ncbi:MAG TPA: hypothetical protein DHV36_14085 [Desulfobacteraceae bacterium]|nr:hypothetical protein [Desulfobacteraceae bacterium]
MTYLPLVLVWVAWCTLHSALVSVPATRRLKQNLGDSFRYFRLVYNGIALLTLIPVLIYSQGLRTLVVFTWHRMLTLPWLLLWGVTLILTVQGARAYDMGQFTGMAQAMSPPTGNVPAADQTLNTGGILGITRHPWYLAALVFLWIRSRNIHLSMVVENIVLTVYLFIGIRLEERKLVLIFKDRYRDYQRRVSPLVPWKWVYAFFRKKA